MANQGRDVALPRIAITYCTQCKWLLRAAYFGQELLSTFGTSIGEVALIPATGGVFSVYLTYKDHHAASNAEAQQVLLWDRKAEGGFPETKILKQRLRNHIEPEKKLGHSDTPSSKATGTAGTKDEQVEKVSTSAGAVSAGSVSVSSDPLLEEATASSVPDPVPDGGKGQECEDCR